jgi:hypothetical protein
MNMKYKNKNKRKTKKERIPIGGVFWLSLRCLPSKVNISNQTHIIQSDFACEKFGAPENTK